MIPWLLAVVHDPLVSAGVMSILTGVVLHLGFDQATAATLAKVAGGMVLSWIGGLLARSPLTPKLPPAAPATKNSKEGD